MPRDFGDILLATVFAIPMLIVCLFAWAASVVRSLGTAFQVWWRNVHLMGSGAYRTETDKEDPVDDNLGG